MSDDPAVPERWKTRYELAKAQLKLLPLPEDDPQENFLGTRVNCEETIQFIEELGTAENLVAILQEYKAVWEPLIKKFAEGARKKALSPDLPVGDYPIEQYASTQWYETKAGNKMSSCNYDHKWVDGKCTVCGVIDSLKRVAALEANLAEAKEQIEIRNKSILQYDQQVTRQASTISQLMHALEKVCYLHGYGALIAAKDIANAALANVRAEEPKK